MIENIKTPAIGLPPGVDPRGPGRPVVEPQSIAVGRGDQAAAPSSFAGRLGSLLHEVSDLQKASAQATAALVRGEPIDLHQVIIRQEEARVAFTMLMETRNRVLDAYREIMRMSI